MIYTFHTGWFDRGMAHAETRCPFMLGKQYYHASTSPSVRINQSRFENGECSSQILSHFSWRLCATPALNIRPSSRNFLMLFSWRDSNLNHSQLSHISYIFRWNHFSSEHAQLWLSVSWINRKSKGQPICKPGNLCTGDVDTPTLTNRQSLSPGCSHSTK